MVLNTNDGTNSGTITINQGANANIQVAPNGTGVFSISGATVGIVTSTAGASPITGRHTATASSSVANLSMNVQKHRTDIALASMTAEPAVIGFSVRDSTNTNRIFARLNATYQGTGTTPFWNLQTSTDGFTTTTQTASLGGGVGVWGAANNGYTHTTNGTGNLTLSTNSGTNSGTIVINQGVNGNIVISPNGTGDVNIDADTLRVGESGSIASILSNNGGLFIATSGTQDLELTVNGGSEGSGRIAIIGAANGNITLTPHGTGNLVLDGVNWPQTGGTANYVLTTNGSTQSSWSQVSLTAGVTGTLPLANGGTNATTARDAWDNLTTYTATNSATETLTNSSNYIQHVYGGSGTTFTLPSTATMTFGEGFYFINTSGQTTTVNTSTSAFVGNIPTDSSMFVYVTNTGSNAATSWAEMRTFGNYTGSGSAVLANAPTISTATLSDATVSTGSLLLKDIRETVYSAGSTTGTITPDCANGSVQTITLTGSITLNAFANPVSGQTMTLIITQPAAGGPYTLTSTMKFAGASKTLSTAANAIDILTISYIGSTYYASLAKGFA